ncbi:hypothetical protein T06_12529 [Trichinella sp. T6]|nr:hypothetical protein T06_12529 [Trichinella sp. T6]
MAVTVNLYGASGYFLLRSNTVLSCTASTTPHGGGICYLAKILHNAPRLLLRTGLFPTAEQFSFIVHRDHYSALGYFPLYSNSLFSCTAVSIIAVHISYSIVLCLYRTEFRKQPPRTVFTLCGIFR